MKRLTVTNQKGGLGKTCISTNIARCLADDFNKKVLFIDFDVQANASETLKSFASPCTCYDFISRDLTDSEVKNFDTATNIVLLKSSIELANSESFDNSCLTFFNNNIKKIEKYFDYMIMDTPPTLGNTLKIALLLSENLITPLELDSFALMGLNKLFSSFRALKQYNNKLNFLGIVINKFVSQRKRQKELFDEIKVKIGDNILFKSKIHANCSIQDALSLSCSLKQLRKIKGYTNNRAINEFYALTSEVLEKIEK